MGLGLSINFIRARGCEAASAFATEASVGRRAMGWARRLGWSISTASATQTQSHLSPTLSPNGHWRRGRTEPRMIRPYFLDVDRCGQPGAPVPSPRQRSAGRGLGERGSLERLKKYCGHSGLGTLRERSFLSFGFVSAQSQPPLGMLLCQNFAKTPKILAPSGYKYFFNRSSKSNPHLNLASNQTQSHLSPALSADGHWQRETGAAGDSLGFLTIRRHT